MIAGEVRGASDVVAKLKELFPSLRVQLQRFAMTFAVKTINYIKEEKLSGQMLKHQTGTLQGSLDLGRGVSEVDAQGNITIGSNLVYARIHEFGGTTKPHDILPRRGQALRFELDGKIRFFKIVHHPGSVIPERSYLRSTLEEKKQEYIDGLFNVAASVTKQ